MVAARAALADAGLAWTDIQFVAGADTIRNGYPGFIAGATFAQKLGWTGVRVSSSYAACASGAQALHAGARADPRRLLRRRPRGRRRHHAEGLLRPGRRRAQDDPDWLRFHLLGATNPVYFALYARRRMDLYGATAEDFAAGEGEERAARPARTRTPGSARRSRSTTCSTVPIVADPLRLLDICATSDGGAALIVVEHGLRRAARSAIARRRAARAGGLHRHAALPADACSSCPTSPPTRRAVVAPPDRAFKDSIAGAAYEEAGHRPRRPQPGRGLRPLDGARARLVREHRAVRRGRGRGAAALGRDRRSAAASR